MTNWQSSCKTTIIALATTSIALFGTACHSPAQTAKDHSTASPVKPSSASEPAANKTELGEHPTEANPIDAPTASANDRIHAPWNELLGNYVSGGWVDYKGMASRRKDLDGYLRRLKETQADELKTQSTNDQLAFWINAYNAYTVALILDNYPIESIWSVTPAWKRVLGGPFALDFIPLGHLAPAPTSDEIALNDIEHEILRKEFNEPRIHVGVVCASIGCPHLQPEAYLGSRLDEQLDHAFRGFLADPAKNRFDAAANRLYVSPIFKWFAEDFAPGGGPAGYFERHGPAAAADALAHAEKPAVEYTEYDWSINEKREAREKP